MNSKQLPTEATECLEKFENVLSSIEKNLQPLLGVSARQLESQVSGPGGKGRGGAAIAVVGMLAALSLVTFYDKWNKRMLRCITPV
jgi:hypothetical protein